MNKKVITLTALATLMSCVQSCHKDQLPVAPNVVITPENINQLQTVFGKALSKALKSDAELREFLKMESLKKFDLDNDILYQMVKDVSISNGETFHDKLTHYITATDLSSIENQLPLLTIFVPSLPSGFSPQTWQTSQEIPKVAVQKLGDSRVPFYNEDGVEAFIQPGDIPGFPLIAIKQSERVMTSKSGDTSSETFFQNAAFSFNFTASTFDGIHPGSEETQRRKMQEAHSAKVLQAKENKPDPSKTNRLAWSYLMASRVERAYQIDRANSGFEWQRDYVYYGITPSVPKGKLLSNFRENIQGMKINNQGIQRMSGYSGDPTLPVVGNMSNGYPVWLDGNYEFLIVLLNNPKDGTPAQRNIRFGARPQDLYSVNYTSVGGGGYYRVDSITPLDFYPFYSIAAWDLQNFGTAWIYHVFEENQTVTTTQQETVSTTYAANFEFDPTFLGFIKGGAKFGASASTNNQKVVTIQYTTGSTDLGEQTAYFYDPIIVGTVPAYGSGAYNTFDLYTGYVTFDIQPLSVVDSENSIP